MSENLILWLLFGVPAIFLTIYLLSTYRKLKNTARGKQTFTVHLMIVLPVYFMINLPKLAFDINLDTIFIIVCNSIVVIYTFVLYKFSENFEYKREREKKLK